MCEIQGCPRDVDYRITYIGAHFGPEDPLVYASVCETCLPRTRDNIHMMGKRMGPVVEV